MKNIILNLAVTLDGFIEGINGEIDWCIMEEDMHFDDFMAGIDTMFYGRVSFDAWRNFQSDQNASPADQRMWQRIHSKNKFAFSTQHKQDEKATFISLDIAGKVVEIK